MINFLGKTIELIHRMPQNEREAFAVFCALNVIREGPKEKLISNDYANAITKPHVIKIVTYALQHPELNLIDKIFLDTSCKPNCIFIVCMGIQFSYHSVPLKNETIKAFCNSDKNEPMEFDGIRKRPKAKEMFEIAQEMLSNDKIDRAVLIERINRLFAERITT